jgi:hypothetical protein
LTFTPFLTPSHTKAAEHYYLLTDTMKAVDPLWPVIEDPRSCTYIRPEGGGLLVGLFETQAAAWNVSHVPDFSFGEIDPDWERMTPFVEKAMSRVPGRCGCSTKYVFYLSFYRPLDQIWSFHLKHTLTVFQKLYTLWFI